MNFLLKSFKLSNLDWTFYVTWINLWLMKHNLINFDWIVNNLIVHNLLKNYLNLIKESIQRQLLIGVLYLFGKIRSSRWQMFFKIGVHKNSARFRGTHQCWSLFLKKLQVCNFPVNIAKFLRTAFFIKHLRWLLLKNS